jgi:hypothetical protein
VSVADPDVWVRILALINYPFKTFLACVKAINTSGISVVKLFGSYLILEGRSSMALLVHLENIVVF